MAGALDRALLWRGHLWLHTEYVQDDISRQCPEDGWPLALQKGWKNLPVLTQQLRQLQRWFHFIHLCLPSSLWRLPYLWTFMTTLFVSNEFLLAALLNYNAALIFHVFLHIIPVICLVHCYTCWIIKSLEYKTLNLMLYNPQRVRRFLFCETSPWIIPFKPNSASIELQNQLSLQICRLSIKGHISKKKKNLMLSVLRLKIGKSGTHENLSITVTKWGHKHA